MKTILFATAAALAAANSANAFTPAGRLVVDPFTHLECVPTYEQPRSNDGNPSYKIEVDLSLADNRNDVNEFNVSHTLVDGSVYDRNDQYTNSNAWAKRGYNEWYWNGYRNRNPNIKMGGRLFRQANGQWFYEEMQFKNGQQIWFMSSRCHVEQQGD